MSIAIRDAKVWENGRFITRDFVIPSEKLMAEYSQLAVLPGFVDVHVHLREPGFSYKETIATGTAAAAKGGYVTVFSMPNLNPVPDSLVNLRKQLEIIEKDAIIPVIPYGSISVEEKGETMAELEAMAPYVCAFSDDGKGVQSREMMREAMLRAKALGRIICAHCEDNSLLKGGYIHDGAYAAAHGHRGICSESEWGPIARDIELVKETGCSYHVCHVSTKESVQLIREAKKDGVNITCETGPHYLALCDEDLQEHGRFKMNPPLRSRADRDALIEGLIDGTIDMIATDHAPHSAEEKAKGLEKSAMGVVGLETAFPVLYTTLVKTGIVSLERIVEAMYTAPCKRFGLDIDPAKNYTVYDLNAQYRVNPEDFATMGRSTPFDGMEVYGACELTVANDKIVYHKQR